MDRILFVNACIRPDSRTLALSKHLLQYLPGAVEELNLEREKILPLNTESLKLRQNLLATEQFDHPMLRYGRQFMQADIIVIAAPYYDFSFPSALKVWLEAIANVGLTFYYDEKEQPVSNCRARKVYYVTTAGSEFVSTFGFEYIKTMFSNFYSIHQAHCFWAEGLDLKDSDCAGIMEEAKKNISRFFGEEIPARSDE